MTKRKILLVDDVQLFLDQQKTFFDKDQFELTFARSGTEALRVAQRENPDLIFMDQYMPGMHGDACCRIIKKTDSLRRIPVVMVTYGEDEEDFEQCWEAGCDEIVPKPINRRYFNAIVKKYLSETEAKEKPEARHPARLRVEYGIGKKRVLADYSLNLSTGGLFLETTAPLPEGTRLELSFGLPDRKESINCSGKVAWVNHPDAIRNHSLPAGVGIQFLDLSLDDMRAIRDSVKSGSLVPTW